MISVLGHDSQRKAILGRGTTWANEINFVLDHAPGAGLITQLVDQQSSALPLYLVQAVYYDIRFITS